jgi:hypothetical protein
MILKQKQGFRRYEYELIDKTIKVKYTTEGKTKEWSVRLEDIGDNITYEANTRVRAYIFSSIIAIFLVFITISLFMSDDFYGNLPIVIGSYLIFGGLIPLLLLMPLKKEMHIVGGMVTLTFFQNSPTYVEAIDFVNELIKRSRKLLLHKYGKIDPDLPEETMMNQLNWLKNRNVISEQQFDQLKEEYKTSRLFIR